MRLKPIFALLVVFILILSITSCNLPVGNQANVDVDATIAAGIMLSQTALALPGSAAVQATSTNTEAIQPGDTATPTLEPTITLTPTITITSTPEGVFLTISQDTFCRKGAPISVFPAVTTIKAGQQVEVIGQNPTNDSYYVRNPNETNSYCWVWGKYATLTGNQQALPVYTLQPTPTSTSTPTPAPAFTASYTGRSNNCGGFYTLNFNVNNTGSITWQSLRVEYKDTITSATNGNSYNTFYDYGATCSRTPEQEDLTAGESGTTFIFALPDTIGHSLNVTITLCSANGMGGTCTSKSLTIVP